MIGIGLSLGGAIGFAAIKAAGLRLLESSSAWFRAADANGDGSTWPDANGGTAATLGSTTSADANDPAVRNGGVRFLSITGSDPANNYAVADGGHRLSSSTNAVRFVGRIRRISGTLQSAISLTSGRGRVSIDSTDNIEANVRTTTASSVSATGGVPIPGLGDGDLVWIDATWDGTEWVTRYSFDDTNDPASVSWTTLETTAAADTLNSNVESADIGVGVGSGASSIVTNGDDVDVFYAAAEQSGTMVAEFWPARDIPTNVGADADIGSFVDSATGAVWELVGPTAGIVSRDHLAFDGTNDYVDTALTPTVSNTGSAWSLAFTYRATGSSFARFISSETGSLNGLIVYQQGGGKLTFMLSDGTSSASLNTDTEFNDGLWRAVVCVVDGATMSLYATDGTSTSRATAGAPTHAPLRIGAGAFASSFTPTDCDISQVVIDEANAWTATDAQAVLDYLLHGRSLTATERILESATLWVDGSTLQTGSQHWLARAGSGAPVLGSTTSSDTNDPATLGVGIVDYLLLPGVVGSYATVPAPSGFDTAVADGFDLVWRGVRPATPRTYDGAWNRFDGLGGARQFVTRFAVDNLEVGAQTASGLVFILASWANIGAPAAGERAWWRVRFTADSDGVNNLTEFWVRPDGDTEPVWGAADYSTTRAGVGAVSPSTSPIAVGTDSAAARAFDGEVMASGYIADVSGSRLVEFDPARDAGAFPSSFTDATSGGAWSLLGDAEIVSAPFLRFDGTDDYVDTDVTPPVSASGNAWTMAVLMRRGASAGTYWFGAEPSANAGLRGTWVGGARLACSVNGSSSVNLVQSFPQDEWAVGAVIVDGSDLHVWDSTNGRSNAVDISGVGTFTPSALRVGAINWSTSGAADIDVGAVVTVDQALTDTELTDVATELLEGYTS